MVEMSKIELHSPQRIEQESNEIEYSQSLWMRLEVQERSHDVQPMIMTTKC